MKICVVGAGAMGCLLGGYLARSGHEVWLTSPSMDHIGALREQGLGFRHGDSVDRISVNAANNPADAGVCDLVLVMTKSKDTLAAIEKATPAIGDGTYVATLQNGIGNVEQLSSVVDPARILFGVTSLGAARTGPGEIEGTALDGAKTFVWSVADEPSNVLTEFVNSLIAAGLDVAEAPDVKERVWRKLCLNCCISALAAVTGLKVGPLVEMSSARTLIRNLVEEVTAVAAKEDVTLDADSIFNELIEDSRRFADHAPSILMDVLSQRKTEIDCLNGAIVRTGAKLGIPTPYNAAITSLIETIEQSYGNRITI